METTDPRAQSWILTDPDSHFPIQNLPYGVFSRAHESPRVCVAIGEYVVDLATLYDEGLISQSRVPFNVFALPRLNEYMACGRQAWQSTRRAVFDVLLSESPTLRDNAQLRRRAVVPMREANMHLPVFVGDYVDFYSSEQHATNVGRMFRPDNPLLPNWKHIPIGYNGRASSVVLSGTPIVRPVGQIVPPGSEEPEFSPTRNLDFELEVGFYAGKANPLGERIAIGDVEEYIFGLSLVNDWSARDIQRWEYQPLGPFLAKTFGTSVSPWVVPLEAISPFRIKGGEQSPMPLEYLRTDEAWHVDVHLEVGLKTERMSAPQTICRTNLRNMYWSMAQQLAHQGSNGTNVQVGDLYASGTISGDRPDSFGSMLELAWRGERPLTMDESGEARSFLQDGDEVVMTGWCQGNGYRIGFGEVSGTILPAIDV